MTSPFRRRTLVTFTVLTGLSFAGGLALMVLDEEVAEVPTAGADSYSFSALGHRGWVELLEASGYSVVRSRGPLPDRLPEEALLVVAAPTHEGDLGERVRQARRALVVLPKWRGEVWEEDRRWVSRVEPVDEAKPNRVLAELGLDARVQRVPGRREAEAWISAWPGGAPLVVDPQLVAGDALEPLVAAPEGVLLGRVRRGSTTVFVLADPDPLSNHGLEDPGNARFSLALAAVGSELGQRPDVVVVDELLHGHADAHRSVFRTLFEFPVVLALAQALLAAGALVWAGAVRFGSPLDLAPAVGAGRRTLVESTVDLLELGDHEVHSVRRYLDLAVEEVSRSPLARGAEGEFEAAREVSRQRGTRDPATFRASLGALAAERPRDRTALRRRCLALSREIHLWREETLHGTR